MDPPVVKGNPRARLLALAVFLAACRGGPEASGAQRSASGSASARGPAVSAGAESLSLPPPSASGGPSSSLEAMARRRSSREWAPEPLSLAELSQLLWAAQGVTDASGRRTAPSAGGLYPLELYLVASRVTGLAAGLYHYQPMGHRLVRVARGGDPAAALCAGALEQEAACTAAAGLVYGAVLGRTSSKYGARAERFVAMEIGHSAQNVLLEAAALGLGAVPIGGIDEGRLGRLVADGEQALYVVAVGRPR